ncbi:MAG: sortase, partial [Acidobacteria bacterium]|nr:sortase [Acidobacteriota bacterium]
MVTSAHPRRDRNARRTVVPSGDDGGSKDGDSAPRRKKPARQSGGVLRTIVAVLGELLITAGVILLLFVAWELWWTNITADHTQQQAVHQFVQQQSGPVKAAPAKSTVDYGPPKISAKPTADGQVFGVVYIPRFGAGYSRPLVQGTATAQLDTLGLGHYDSTAMPGAIGNFVVAAHQDDLLRAKAFRGQD